MARKKFEDKQYCISGRVIDKASRQGLVGLRVEAWDLAARARTVLRKPIGVKCL